MMPVSYRPTNGGRMDRERQQEQLVALIMRGSQPSDQLGVGSRLASSMFTSEMLKVLSESRNG